ncbi:hypothetical protein CFPU101_10500 [Chroococcus sp. FPU101]|nr:hypothetical protein CFPU101_10500 [Chroococcus sp. FPU101]
MPDRAKWNKGKWYFIHNNLLDEGSPSITIPITEKYKKILQPLVEKANNKLKRIVIG